MAVHKIVVPAAWKTASKEAVKFDPRSRIRNRPRVCPAGSNPPLSRWAKHPPGKPRTCRRITKITTTISQDQQPAATRRRPS
jgi:hypothetical protein